MGPGDGPMRALMAPESVAVVGASPRGSRGSVVLANMKRLGYGGGLFAVHPTADEVEGIACYPSLRDLPQVPEFVAVTVGADRVGDVMAEAAAVGAKAALVIAAGFEEASGTGATRSATLESVAVGAGMAVCGPNCYGIFDAHSGFAAYSGPIVDPLQRGSVGFILQSGAITHAIHDSAIGRGLGISTVVTSGNETVTRVGDYLDWMAADERTEVVGLFVEQIRDAARFADAARRAAGLGKRVVALKAGRTARGRAATQAHTGAISGSAAAYRAFFERHGVDLVHDVDEFREALVLLSADPARRAGSVAVVALSGGVSGLVADLAEELGYLLPRLSDRTTRALAAVLPDFASPSNPLDMTGAAAERPGILRDAVLALASADEIDGVAVAFNVAQRSEGQRALHREQARILAELRAEVDLPLAAFAATSGPVDPEVERLLSSRGIPNLAGAREALVALSRWQPAPVEQEVLPAATSAARPLPGVLSGPAAFAVLEEAGIPTAPWAGAATVEEAVAAAERIGFPVAVKVGDSETTHKSDVGGVVLDLTDADAVAAATGRFLAAVGPAPSVLVQKMARPGVECLLGVTRDPDLGLQIVLSPGGVLAELYAAAVTRPLPIGPAEAEQMIGASILDPIVDGYRGAARADRKALIDALCRLSDLALSYGEQLEAIDVNPFILHVEGSGGIAVDAVLIPIGSGTTSNVEAQV